MTTLNELKITKHTIFKFITAFLIYMTPVILFITRLTSDPYGYYALERGSSYVMNEAMIKESLTSYQWVLYGLIIMLVLAVTRIIVGVKNKRIDILGIVITIIMIFRIAEFDFSVFNFIDFSQQHYMEFLYSNMNFKLLPLIELSFKILYILFIIWSVELELKLSKLVFKNTIHTNKV